MIDKRTARSPEFPRLLDAARRRRELLRTLTGQRERQKRSQTAIAVAMHTHRALSRPPSSTQASPRWAQGSVGPPMKAVP
jgi:hypothetical protein